MTMRSRLLGLGLLTIVLLGFLTMARWSRWDERPVGVSGESASGVNSDTRVRQVDSGATSTRDENEIAGPLLPWQLDVLVVDAADGRPLDEAVVVGDADGLAWQATGLGNGKYRLSLTSEHSRVTIRASRSGFISGSAVATRSTTLTQVRLSAKVAVVVRVVSPEGAPIHKARVLVSSLDVGPTSPPFEALTDESGNAAVGHFQSSTLVAVGVSHPDYAPLAARAEILASAMPLVYTLARGHRLFCDLSQLSRPFNVAVQITASGTTLQTMWTDHLLALKGQINQALVGVLPNGAYRLRAYSNGTLFADQQVLVQDRDVTVTLTGVSTTAVSVTIRCFNAAGEPVAAARVMDKDIRGLTGSDGRCTLTFPGLGQRELMVMATGYRPRRVAVLPDSVEVPVALGEPLFGSITIMVAGVDTAHMKYALSAQPLDSRFLRHRGGNRHTSEPAQSLTGTLDSNAKTRPMTLPIGSWELTVTLGSCRWVQPIEVHEQGNTLIHLQLIDIPEGSTSGSSLSLYDVALDRGSGALERVGTAEGLDSLLAPALVDGTGTYRFVSRLSDNRSWSAQSSPESPRTNESGSCSLVIPEEFSKGSAPILLISDFSTSTLRETAVHPRTPGFYVFPSGLAGWWGIRVEKRSLQCHLSPGATLKPTLAIQKVYLPPDSPLRVMWMWSIDRACPSIVLKAAPILDVEGRQIVDAIGDSILFAMGTAESISFEAIEGSSSAPVLLSASAGRLVRVTIRLETRGHPFTGSARLTAIQVSGVDTRRFGATAGVVFEDYVHDGGPIAVIALPGTTFEALAMCEGEWRAVRFTVTGQPHLTVDVAPR